MVLEQKLLELFLHGHFFVVIVVYFRPVRSDGGWGEGVAGRGVQAHPTPFWGKLLKFSQTRQI